MSEEEKRLRKREREQRRSDRKKRKKRSKQLNVLRKYVLFAAAILLIGYGLFSVVSGPQIGPIGSTHEHLDFLVYIDGTPIDLNQSRYALQSSYAHVHDNEGDIIHLHAINIPLTWFMDSLGLPITENSIKVNGIEYTSDGDNELLVFVNEEKITNLDYALSDEDKLLIYYGPESDIEFALSLVPNRAVEVNNAPNRGD